MKKLSACPLAQCVISDAHMKLMFAGWEWIIRHLHYCIAFEESEEYTYACEGFLIESSFDLLS